MRMTEHCMTSALANQKFDRNQIKEFICNREDDIALFIGFEFNAARIIANISRQVEDGALSQAAGKQLLEDAYHLGRLAKLGYKYAKWARNPPAEMAMMVLERT